MFIWYCYNPALQNLSDWSAGIEAITTLPIIIQTRVLYADIPNTPINFHTRTLYGSYLIVGEGDIHTGLIVVLTIGLLQHHHAQCRSHLQSIQGTDPSTSSKNRLYRNYHRMVTRKINLSLEHGCISPKKSQLAFPRSRGHEIHP